MTPIVSLLPHQLQELADSTEDEAYDFPNGPRRQQLLATVYQMRAAANRALWLGDEAPTEIIDAPKSLPPRGRK